MYAAVFSADVRGRPSDVRSANRTSKRTWDHRTYATFWNTIWVMPGHTRHPLDHCTRTTGRMLGLPEVRYSVRELVANFPNK
jgi:hypothetical protein